MNDAPLISVIVPVYNVEDYVEQCVESVVAQDYPNLEIILVDDGATDSSGKICDLLGEKYSNVTVLHKENGGLSDARNYGLAHSHGEWISFIDSDDYVSPIFVSTLFRAAQICGCSIAAVPHGKDFHDGEKCKLIDKLQLVVQQENLSESLADKSDSAALHHAMIVKLTDHEALYRLLYQSIDTGAQWRLYRRDTLGDSPFPRGLYYEDLASVYRIVHDAGSMVLIDCPELYAYRLRSMSIIRQSYRHLKGYSAVTIATQMYHDITGWYPDLAAACSSRCFSVCRMVYGQVPKGSNATMQEKADSEALWKVLEANRNVVAFDSEARLRERLAAGIARMGERPFDAFCSLARNLGLMQ